MKSIFSYGNGVLVPTYASITNLGSLYQALQEECDRITDDLDIKTKEIKELKKIIAEADKRNDEIRCQHDSLVQKTEALSKTNDAIEAEKLE